MLSAGQFDRRGFLAGAGAPGFALALRPVSAQTMIRGDDAGHAVHADDRPGSRRNHAENGWRRLLACFKRHGV